MKNEKTTIYELMGLIKDNKAPKKIKFGEDIYTYVPKEHNYKDSERYSLFGHHIIDITNFLVITVEILPEENDEWEDIKEIQVGDVYDITKVLNKLIKNQQKIIEKLDDNTCIRDKAELELFINERINEKMNKDIGVNNKL